MKLSPESARSEDARVLFAGALWTKRKDQIWYQQMYSLNAYGLMVRVNPDGKGKLASLSGSASGASTARSSSPAAVNMTGQSGISNMFAKIAQLPIAPPKSYDRIDLSDCRSVAAETIDGNFLDIGDRQQLPGFMVQDKDGTSYRFVARSCQEQATWISTLQAFLNQNHSACSLAEGRVKSVSTVASGIEQKVQDAPTCDLASTSQEDSFRPSQNWLVASGYSEDVLAELTSLRAEVRELQEDKRSLQLALSVALEKMAAWTTTLFGSQTQAPEQAQSIPQPAHVPQERISVGSNPNGDPACRELVSHDGDESPSAEDESADRLEALMSLQQSRIVSADLRNFSSPEPTMLSPHALSPPGTSREAAAPSPNGSFRSKESAHSHSSRCKYA